MIRRRPAPTAPSEFRTTLPAAGPQTADDAALWDIVLKELEHDHRDIFDKLKPGEKEYVLRWVRDAMHTGDLDNHAADILWEVDYIRKPVSLTDFLRDHYYGGGLFVDNKDSCSLDVLSPKWIEDLEHIFAPGSGISQWILTGSLGIGKTTVAMLALVFILYRLSCLKTPAEYYGLPANSLFVLGLYSLTKKQVGGSGFPMIKGYVDRSPYFRECFPRNMKLDSFLDWSRTTHIPVTTVAGSSSLQSIGLNIYAFAMDEANFFRSKRNKDDGKQIGAGYELYSGTLKRIKSRFVRPGGEIPGMCMLMSSKTSQTSFLEQQIRDECGSRYVEGIRGRISPTTYVSDLRLWEAKGEHKFGKARFMVEVGDRVHRTRILTPGSEARAGAKVVPVPEEFRRDFEKDPDASLRDIAGVATFNVSPLIHDGKSVLDAVNPDLVDPFKAPEISITTDDDTALASYFDHTKVCSIRDGVYRPNRHTMNPRFIHVDIGLTCDALGIAMAHPVGTLKVTERLPDGTQRIVRRPIAEVDFMVRVRPPRSGEIALWKVRDFIDYLAQFYSIAHVSFDGYQSRDSVQLLTKAGFSAEVTSLDATDLPYLTLRNALFERRVHYPKHPRFELEVLDLQRFIADGGREARYKVDHPEQASDGSAGSKDVADAVCGAVYHAFNHPEATTFLDSTALAPAAIAAEKRDNGPATAHSPTPKAAAAATVSASSVHAELESLRENL